MLWFEQEHIAHEVVAVRDHEWVRVRRGVTRYMISVACVAVSALVVFQLLCIYDL